MPYSLSSPERVRLDIGWIAQKTSLSIDHGCSILARETAGLAKTRNYMHMAYPGELSGLRTHKTWGKDDPPK